MDINDKITNVRCPYVSIYYAEHKIFATCIQHMKSCEEVINEGLCQGEYKKDVYNGQSSA